MNSAGIKVFMCKNFIPIYQITHKIGTFLVPQMKPRARVCLRLLQHSFSVLALVTCIM